ncbi:MAG: calcium/proton exchanger [Candidatus Chloroheliales bacterium]|nr:MAG: calcium/proton exchanger [Chloroflexota bacterium]
MAERRSIQPRQISLDNTLSPICGVGGPTLVEKILYTLLIFVPVAFVVGFTNAGGGLWVFFSSALAIVPMAKLLGTATEELAVRVGSGLGGLLNSTFGNATELIIAFFALQAGLIDVVKASITGSIIGNLLFVLGLAVLTGGIKHEKQTFNAVAVSASSSQMGVATIALVIPAVFAFTTPESLRGGLVENLSLGVAGVLLLSYFAQLLFTLRTHPHLYTEQAVEGVGGQAWPIRKSLLILAVCTIVIAFLSEFLVNGVEYLTSTLGWTELFVGVILIALIGNAAENMTAVTVAMKNKMNLSMSIAMGSSTQIALFVAPVLVFIGFFMGGSSELTLLFQPFEIAAIVMAVVIVDRIARDGESNWFEGVQLLAVYTIFAVAFFLHP